MKEINLDYEFSFGELEELEKKFYAYGKPVVTFGRVDSRGTVFGSLNKEATYLFDCDSVNLKITSQYLILQKSFSRKDFALHQTGSSARFASVCLNNRGLDGHAYELMKVKSMDGVYAIDRFNPIQKIHNYK